MGLCSIEVAVPDPQHGWKYSFLPTCANTDHREGGHGSLLHRSCCTRPPALLEIKIFVNINKKLINETLDAKMAQKKRKQLGYMFSFEG